MNIRKFALNLAAEIHKDQKRKDGLPYITHLEAVANNALKIHKETYPNTEEDNADRDILYLIATQHDAKEDQNYEESLYGEQLSKAGFAHPNRVVASLKLLNKKQYANYFDYIMAVKHDYFARTVKLADLTHNMSNLQEGSLKDKYRLAEYILTH